MTFNDENELIEYYSKFKNFSLKSIKGYSASYFPEIKLITNKGIVGQVMESVIGNSPNNSPNPDVLNLGIELKVMPLRRVSNNLMPKERSKIKKINYDKLLNESWEDTSLKKKITKILFFLYEQPSGKTYNDWEEFIFLGTLLFKMDGHLSHIIKKDWQEIQYKVKSKLAHELSESDSKILGACTSGKGRIETYGGHYKAKERSYSLKHNYLKLFYLENYKKKKFKRLTKESLGLDKNKSNNKFEYLFKEKIKDELAGRSLNELVNIFNIKNINFKNDKSAFPRLIKKVFNVESDTEIRNLEENNIVIKTIPVDENYKPYESMSFNKFSLVDLLFQEWDGDNDDDKIGYESEFKNLISRTFLFIPLIKLREKEKYNSWKEWVVGEPKIWFPSDREFSIIKKEWEYTKNIVIKGIKVWDEKFGRGYRQRNNLTKESETEIIHLRPKARDSKDIDKEFYNYSKKKISISNQCFWFNKKFIFNILKNKT